MRSAFGKFCFLIAAISFALLFVLPSGSPASLAPLGALAVLAPLGASLWRFDARPVHPTMTLEVPIPRSEIEIPPNRNAARRLVTAKKHGSVTKFMSARLTRSESARTSVDELFETYQQWSAANELTPLERSEFLQRLNTVCDLVGIARENRSLINVALN